MAFQKLAHIYFFTRFNSEYCELIALEQKCAQKEDAFIYERDKLTGTIQELLTILHAPSDHIIALGRDPSPREHADFVRRHRSSEPSASKAEVKRKILTGQYNTLSVLLHDFTRDHGRLVMETYGLWAARIEASTAREELVNSISTMARGRRWARQALQEKLSERRISSEEGISRGLGDIELRLEEVKRALGALKSRIVEETTRAKAAEDAQLKKAAVAEAKRKKAVEAEVRFKEAPVEDDNFKETAGLKNAANGEAVASL